MSEQNDIENVWEELVGDAITPLPPPPQFAGAIDEEMQARPSARLPLHVVPLSGPDSDALPIEPTRAHEEPRAPQAKKVDVRRRPQTEADALAAPQAVVAADPVVALDLRGRKVPTLRTEPVPNDDELDVVLLEVAQTGPHKIVPTDEIVELDVTDLDVDEIEAADGRAVIDVDLVDEDAESAVAGVIDLADPSAAPRTDGPRALARSAAIAHAMRGATVRVPLVPERKVKTAMLSVSRVHPAPRPTGAGAKATTVKTAAVAVAVARARPTTMRVEALAARAEVPLAVVPALAVPVTPTPPPAPAIVPSSAASSSSLMMMRRVVVGERVVAPQRGMFAWIAGAAVLGLSAIGVAALTGGDDPPPPAAAASAIASEQAPAPVVETPVLEPLTPANASPPTPPPDTTADDARRAAGLAYVAAVERHEADQSNEALEQMVSAACAMDDGPRARSAFRKLRGGDQRSRVMIACRDRGIDLWARVDGPTAAELLTVAERQLAEGDWVHALQTARESNHVSRNNGALLVLGIAHCRLGRPAEADELERHLPPRMRADLQKACSSL